MTRDHSTRRLLRGLVPISIALSASLAFGNIATAQAGSDARAKSVVRAVAEATLPSCGTIDTRQNEVQNKDCVDLHLMMRAFQGTPDSAVLSAMKVQAAAFAAGRVASPVTTPILQAVLGPLFPILGWVAIIYTAVSFLFDIPDLVQNLEGGTYDSVSRRSGYCQNVWETIARVKTAKAGMSTSVDMFWVSKGRPTTSYIRYVFATYLGRQPTCAELRSELAKFYPGGAINKMFSTDEDAWSDGIAQNVLNNVVCDSRSSDGVRWSTKVASSQGNTWKAASIATYCGYLEAGRSEPWKAVQLAAAADLAGRMSERCPTGTIPSHRFVRNSIQVADPPGQFDGLDDLYSSIGRPPEKLDSHKTGRVVNTFTINAVMSKFPKNLNAWTAYVFAGKLGLNHENRNLVCAWAGPWVQVADRGMYGTFANTLGESDQILRDYVDFKAGQAFGHDSLALTTAVAAGLPEGERLRVNMFVLFSSLIEGRCGQVNVNATDSLQLNEQRTVCKDGHAGYDALKELVG